MSQDNRRRPGRGEAPDPGNLKNGGEGEALIDQIAEGTLKQVGTSIVRDAKGRYFWLHEVNLYRNLMFLFLVMKIFFFIWIGVTLFIIGLSLRQGSLMDTLGNMGLPMLYVFLFLVFLITLSYYSYAFMAGGRYSVLFQMDRKGISHTQLPKEFKRARTVGAIAAVAGLLTGSYSAAGAGMLSAGNSSMYTDFKKVNAVKPRRGQQVIKLRSGLMHNQVYTAREDFDFVLDFIRKHTEKPAS